MSEPVPELEVRLPYAAWGSDSTVGSGDGTWWEPSDALQEALWLAQQECGIDSDDTDHTNDYISYFLIGEDVPAMAQLASDVLARHGVLEQATAVMVDRSDEDSDWPETVVELPAPRG